MLSGTTAPSHTAAAQVEPLVGRAPATDVATVTARILLEAFIAIARTAFHKSWRLLPITPTLPDDTDIGIHAIHPSCA